MSTAEDTPAASLIARFETADAFAAALDARTRVPAERVAEFLDSSDLELAQQFDLLTEVEAQLAEVAELLNGDEEAGPRALAAVDPHVFTRDHGWREIVLTLLAPPGAPVAYLRAAVAKYRDYLRFRRELVQFIRERRESAAHAVLEDTSVFDRPASEVTPMASDRFVRLPRGAPVRFALEPGQTLDLMLASHALRIDRAAEQLALVDPAGRVLPLGRGRVRIGRDPENDLVLDGELQEVSRFHLVVEWQGGAELAVTDLSTLGSFVSPRARELQPASV